jgi:hypothetical protein
MIFNNLLVRLTKASAFVFGGEEGLNILSRRLVHPNPIIFKGDFNRRGGRF